MDSGRHSYLREQRAKVPQLARPWLDCRDNKGKLAKRVFTCLIEFLVKFLVSVYVLTLLIDSLSAAAGIKLDRELYIVRKRFFF